MPDEDSGQQTTRAPGCHGCGLPVDLEAAQPQPQPWLCGKCLIVHLLYVERYTRAPRRNTHP